MNDEPKTFKQSNPTCLYKLVTNHNMSYNKSILKNHTSFLKQKMRSISFPARSQHSVITRIETELTKLHDHSISSSSTMAESIFYSLSRLEELHDGMDEEILALQSTRQALSNPQNSLLDTLLEASLKLLDVCSFTRDAMLGIKEHVQHLQTIMRRRRSLGGVHDSKAFDTITSNYTSFRKRMNKEAKRNISILKQVVQDLESSMPSHPEQQLKTLMIRGVKDVILTDASIFESILTFLSAYDYKTKRSSSSALSSLALASRFKTKGNNVSANELGKLDADLCKNGTCVVEVSSKIQTVSIIVDGMESSLERVFRCLIKTRATFLNIRSN